MDIERVIEELSKNKMIGFLTIANTGNAELDNAYKILGDSIDLAIQTIRELQSKSEEVCEWKMQSDNADEWTPSCENNSVFNVSGVAWFKYCPYCDRKIKVVE